MSTTTVRLQRADTTFTQSLYITDCANCGVVFAITAELEARRREDRGAFYCPNGHSLVFGASTETTKLQQELERTKRDLAWRREQLDAARTLAQGEARRAAAARGQLTKLRNRVARGLCPKAGCQRSFSNLHDHVQHEHPELLAAVNEASE